MSAAAPLMALGLLGALLRLQLVDDGGGDPIAGISWPSLGVAGGSILAVLSMLVWLVRREASSYWTTTAKAKADLDRADAQHAIVTTGKDAEIAAWRGAFNELQQTHSETTTAFAASVEANRANDRGWNMVMPLLARFGVSTPQQGDNAGVEVPK